MELKNIFKNVRKALFIASLSVVSVFASAQETPEEAVAEASAGNADAGQALFEANCTSCHQLGSNASYPDLVDITKRRDDAWLKAWIKNPQKFAETDSDAADLIAEWKPKAGVMSSFSYLSDEELSSLTSFLAVAKPTAAEAAPVTSVEGGSGKAVAQDNSQMTMVLALVLVALALIVIVLLLMYSAIMKNLKDQETAGALSAENAEYVNQSHSIFKIFKHPAFIGSVAIIVILLGSWWALHNIIFKIGVDTGYHPTQPIPFSHKLHAGDMEIDCNYCHTGVRKTKHANVPSGSICMNCHIKIKTESDILNSTLYRAMDFNPETGEFGPNQKPIEWVRVHNLPDHVYFNHSQHVQVGGLDCEECHGPVKEMGTVYQYSTLTMGWCVDCHRNKVINSKGNEYYDNLVELHNESGEEFTVEKNGGLECARCHY